MPSKTTDILLVGKTGNGKSATGNSLVGYKAFQSKSSTSSVTTETQFEYGEFEGRYLKVVDGPGIGDTRLDNEDAVKLVTNAMTYAVAANPEGYHAILVVVKCGVRFTQEDVKSVELLKDIFGQDFIRRHGILIMTHGDDLKEESEPFEKWILKQKGAFHELTKECSNRVLLFDNRTNDLNIKKEQTRKLLEMIDNMAGNGARYTSDIFNSAKKVRDGLIKKSKKPKLSADSLMECGIINQQLSRIDFENPEDAVILLENLNKRTAVLEHDIIKQDEGTNSLSAATYLVQQLKKSLSEAMASLNEIMERKQQMQQKEVEFKMECAGLEECEKRKHEDERRRLEDLEKQREQRKTMQQQIKLELEEREKRKREDKRTQQEEIEQQRNEYKRLIKEKEGQIKSNLEFVRKNYENVKKEETWTWGSVASALVGPVVGTLTRWFSKKDKAGKDDLDKEGWTFYPG